MQKLHTATSTILKNKEKNYLEMKNKLEFSLFVLN